MAGNRSLFNEAIKNAYNAAWDSDWSKAIESYRRALAEFPQDVSAHLSLAQALEASKQFESALDEYRLVSKHQPGDPVPLCQIAVLHEKLGQKAEAATTYVALAEIYAGQKAAGKAVEAWQKATALDPERVDVREKIALALEQAGHRSRASKEYVSIAQIHARHGDKASAIEQVKKALALDPRNKDAQSFYEELESGASAPLKQAPGPIDQAKRIALGRLAETLLGGHSAATDLDETEEPKQNQEKVGPTTAEIDAWIANAIDAQSQHRLSEAITVYKQLLAAGIERPEIKFNLGSLLLETGKNDEAVQWLIQTVDDSNYSLASHYAIGRCLRNQGKLDQAAEHFLQVTKIVDLGNVRRDQADELISAYEGLAESFAAKGDPERAEAFSRSLEAFLSSKGWEDKLNEVRGHLQSLRQGGGRVSLAEVINIPESGKVLEALALAQEQTLRGKYQAASEECYRAIEFAPDYMPAHIRLAEILVKQGRIEEAVAKYITLAELALLRGELSRAEELYRQILKVSPNDVTAHSRLIELESQSGKIEASVEQYLELGNALQETGQLDEAAAKLAEGRRIAEQAGISNSTTLELYRRLAQMADRKGDLHGAYAILREIIGKWPDDERTHVALIDLEFRMGQADVASRDLENLLQSHRLRGTRAEAISALETLVQNHPGEALLRARLAQCYIEAKEKEKALSTLDALGEIQLSAGQKRAAAATIRQIIAMVPPRAEEYKQLLKQIEG